MSSLSMLLRLGIDIRAGGKRGLFVVRMLHTCVISQCTIGVSAVLDVCMELLIEWVA